MFRFNHLFANNNHLDLNHRNIRQPVRAPRVVRPRMDPLTMLNNFEFKRNFRFNKENVVRLANLLFPQPEDGVVDGRGSPLTPVQLTCIALNHWGGANLTRVSAYCGDVSYTAAWHAVDKVRSRLVELAPTYITMPTVPEMEATAKRMEEKFSLPGFAYAIDGMHVRFDGCVKNIPAVCKIENYSL